MKRKYSIILILIVLLFTLSCFLKKDDNNQNSVAPTVHRIDFGNIDTPESDPVRTLKSVKREGELYMITYYGEYNSLLEDLNERIINEGIGSVVPENNARFKCSVFTALGDLDHPILGRNFDNNIERGVLVGLYSPPDGYQSIAMSRMSDMGFDRGQDPTLLPVDDRQLLLNSVFFPTDGMNQQGISIALATGATVTINRNNNKKLIFITYLLREVLDHSGNLGEAVEIIRSFDVFDVDTSRISNHLLISGPDGQSIIAEYYKGEWKFMYNDRPWQIITNNLLFNVPEEERRNDCWRYRTIDDFMQGLNGRINWVKGMNLLESISVEDTQWSSLYNMNNKEIYISLYRNFDDIFLLKVWQ
jgi:hypothetical protein